MEYGLFGILVLALDIYAIYKTFISSASTLSKVLWTLGIVLFPLLGVVIWFIAGPKGDAMVRV